MLILSRLIARGSISLARSIGYASAGAQGGASRSVRSPDDECRHRPRVIPVCFFQSRGTGPVAAGKLRADSIRNNYAFWHRCLRLSVGRGSALRFFVALSPEKEVHHEQT